MRPGRGCDTIILYRTTLPAPTREETVRLAAEVTNGRQLCCEELDGAGNTAKTNAVTVTPR